MCINNHLRFYFELNSFFMIIILYMIEYESLYAKKIEHPCLVGINMYLKWELTCT